jgi:hypothetical protein
LVFATRNTRRRPLGSSSNASWESFATSIATRTRKRASAKVAPNVWHTLRVDFVGNTFTVTYDGRKAFDWNDETFKDAGKIGVWTKADSVTLFDDFSYGEP